MAPINGKNTGAIRKDAGSLLNNLMNSRKSNEKTRLNNANSKNLKNYFKPMETSQESFDLSSDSVPNATIIDTPENLTALLKKEKPK
jgi:hypothetical protein